MFKYDKILFFSDNFKRVFILFKELFEDVGAIRVARVHFDENGQSLGTAEVVFERRVDAVNAQQKYNGLNLDGKTFKQNHISIYIYLINHVID